MAKRKKPGTKLQQIPARTQLRPGEESIEEKRGSIRQDANPDFLEKLDEMQDWFDREARYSIKARWDLGVMIKDKALSDSATGAIERAQGKAPRQGLPSQLRCPGQARRSLGRTLAKSLLAEQVLLAIAPEDQVDAQSGHDHASPLRSDSEYHRRHYHPPDQSLEDRLSFRPARSLFGSTVFLP